MGSRVPLAIFCFFAIFNVNAVYSYPSSASSNAGKNSTLQLVHMLMRHGPRTPVNTYPNDPYRNNTFYPYGWGQLTNNAKAELYKLGNWLRMRYKNELGPYFFNDLLYAQATVSGRTHMTLATLFAAMFPPKNSLMEWNTKLNWQPIPIYSLPEKDDIWLRMQVPCPRYDQAFQEALQLPEVAAEHAESQSLFDELSEITGTNITTADDVNTIFVILQAQEAYGLKLPAWTKKYYPEKLRFMAEQTYVYNAYTPELRKLKGGPFVQKMFNEWQSKARGELVPKDRKFFMYGAHDWTLTNVLATMNVWKRAFPRFSAMALFELHKDLDTEEYYVEIYYKYDPNKPVKRLTVPGCEFQCPLEKLIKLTKAVLPNGTYEEMCEPKNTST
ncbi:venom acid phosphatase Acph-1-like isoform X3 [Teleopsis dalmanni]|uniref:venom acid phosphatase Acph-1-like isoform X3 n=1 Tax=Teleopsis dalmanni TaxID=139649 RepID=UPI0018CFD498|nr:venom acid phosphatase Acph-1-like isoform X3 [Teleopsis dalmanni]